MKRSLLLLAFLSGCAHSPIAIPSDHQVESRTRMYGWTQVPVNMSVGGRYALASDGDIYGFTRINSSTDGIAQVTPQGVVTAYAISGFPLSGSSNQAITPHPDGDVYAIEETDCLLPCNPLFLVARLSGGSITEIQVPFTQQGDFSEAIVTGSDGNIWILHHYGVYKLTPQGQWTDYAGGPFGGLVNIVRGPDKNLWVLAGDNGANALVRVNVADGTLTTYAAPQDARGLVQGADKNLYALGADKVYAIATNGAFTPYAVSPDPWKWAVATSGRLWWVSGTHKNVAFAWSTRTHKIVVRSDVPGGQCCDFNYVNGLGGDLWVFQATVAQVLTSSTPPPAKTQ